MTICRFGNKGDDLLIDDCRAPLNIIDKISLAA